MWREDENQRMAMPLRFALFVHLREWIGALVLAAERTSGDTVEEYTDEDAHREYYTHKACAPKCTVSCVQQVGILDNWRAPQTLQPEILAPKSDLVQIAK